MSDLQAGHHPSGGEHHVLPVRTYVTIVSLLFVFTVITVLAAFVEMGPLNTPVALAIAVFKATLVVLFFMHVRYNTPLMWVFAAAGSISTGKATTCPLRPASASSGS